MKNHQTTLLSVLICVFSFSAVAQTQPANIKQQAANSTNIFHDLPDRIFLNVDNLNTLLNMPVGLSVSINLSEDTPFIFEGQIVSVSDKENEKVRTIVVRSSNYKGASLSLTKTLTGDNSISFNGRIMSFQNQEMLEMNNIEGRIVFIKRKQNDLVRE